MAAFIIYIIRWAVCLTLLYSLFGLFLKRETLHGINRIVLLFVLVASMALPFVQISTREANIVTQGREMIERQIANVQNPLSDEMRKVPVANPDNGMGSTRIPVREEVNNYILVAIVVYLVGLAVYWLRYFWLMAALVSMLRRSNRIEVEGVPGRVHVVTHPGLETPCSWMQWIILHPADVHTRAIIQHEWAHIRLGHSWDMLLCELTCRMLWFVPFAWMLRQDLRDVHEYQADRCVLQSGIDENEYQLLLIRKAARPQNACSSRTGMALQPVMNAFDQSPIKRRFKMMYRKPSRRWVALKAAYLVPLSALALVAFARPQTLGEIEEKVEQEVVKYVGAATWSNAVPDRADPIEPTVRPEIAEVEDTARIMPDANLVKADLAESGSVAGGFYAKSPVQLLDSTMQAVGARKIGEGVYLGHFQPQLNGDTVRIARATILSRESKPTGEHLFVQNAGDPYAYNITLNAETRKDRSGYYIRYLQPVSSTRCHYDKKVVDPYMLSTDSVLTGRSSEDLPHFMPIAIERNKKETRIFMYVGFLGKPQVDTWRQQNTNRYSDYALVDELTGDKYVCRATDYSYFKYVKDEVITYVKGGQSRNDTASLYQTCLVFPPLGKRVNKAHFGSVEHDGRYSNTFILNELPRKGRIITH